MKKINKVLIVMIISIFILPFSITLTGCSHGNMEVRFYDINYNLIESKVYAYEKYDNSGDYGLPAEKIIVPDAPQLGGYENIGWYKSGYGEPKPFDEISHSIFDFEDGTWFGSDYGISFIAAYKIKDDGWVYSGNDTNAFLWESGTYASPAIKLVEGYNYIKFDKITTTEKLKYCQIFENGGDGNYVESLEILDQYGFKLSDIDVSSEKWENIEQQTSNTSSFIIKIKATTSFEAGIMIGSDIS